MPSELCEVGFFLSLKPKIIAYPLPGRQKLFESLSNVSL